MKMTEPPIAVRQNSAARQRMLAAQSVLYTRAKRLRRCRLMAVVVSAVLLTVATLLFGDATAPIGVVGGLVVLFTSLIQTRREGDLVERAVAIQEQFDTQVFGLTWNKFAVPHQPTPQSVQEASEKFRGRPTKDWYPDTETVIRPLDVLICQQANLGWGTTIHRRWAGVLWASSGVLVAGLLVLSWLLNIGWWPTLNALFVPFAPVLFELLSAASNHKGSADDKEEAHRRLMEVWREGLRRPIAEQRVRAVQDCVANLRRRNAQVPDWFDGHFRPDSERTMRAAAADLVDEARSHGKA
ncbi:S-4TM family putative pore-forming effector [Janibacter sp. G368]|uniref:S-4TM family putative pore-forming effector n=1 Tax=Janibacter sp. G368 TaxID=3420441 RepID=UPI003CFF307D